eukprot:TRINITY_DN16233_c0_g1_i1.p1 TRINITY_DN16233_c0_g1~~TRINITY_DN16233_c0_g1_i1.p1  ORF type:complete len:566 (+),score=90.90 TRINITY_DN16233_c0_g1_i1:91-1698(+)
MQQPAAAVPAALLAACLELARLKEGGAFAVETATLVDSDFAHVIYDPPAEATSELLVHIFRDHRAKEHDGITVLRGDRVVLAGVKWPHILTARFVPRNWGTRHCSALQFCWATGNPVFVVSEESQCITAAHRGPEGVLQYQSVDACTQGAAEELAAVAQYTLSGAARPRAGARGSGTLVATARRTPEVRRTDCKGVISGRVGHLLFDILGKLNDAADSPDSVSTAHALMTTGFFNLVSSGTVEVEYPRSTATIFRTVFDFFSDYCLGRPASALEKVKSRQQTVESSLQQFEMPNAVLIVAYALESAGHRCLANQHFDSTKDMAQVETHMLAALRALMRAFSLRLTIEVDPWIALELETAASTWKSMAVKFGLGADFCRKGLVNLRAMPLTASSPEETLQKMALVEQHRCIEYCSAAGYDRAWATQVHNALMTPCRNEAYKARQTCTAAECLAVYDRCCSRLSAVTGSVGDCQGLAARRCRRDRMRRQHPGLRAAPAPCDGPAGGVADSAARLEGGGGGEGAARPGQADPRRRRRP